MNASANTTKPVDFDQLYPGRFIKAGELLGKRVTLTIASVDLEELVGEDSKPKMKATLNFRETPKGHVMCKTNGLCIKAMFGKSLDAWVGKRVTFFPDTWNGEPCIRVWGSPDIPADFDVTVTLPRKRPMKKTMHKVVGRNGAGKAAATDAGVETQTAATYLRGLSADVLGEMMDSDAGLDDLRAAAVARAESEGWSYDDAVEHAMAAREAMGART